MCHKGLSPFWHFVLAPNKEMVKMFLLRAQCTADRGGSQEHINKCIKTKKENKPKNKT